MSQRNIPEELKPRHVNKQQLNYCQMCLLGKTRNIAVFYNAYTVYGATHRHTACAGGAFSWKLDSPINLVCLEGKIVCHFTQHPSPSAQKHLGKYRGSYNFIFTTCKVWFSGTSSACRHTVGLNSGTTYMSLLFGLSNTVRHRMLETTQRPAAKTVVVFNIETQKPS